jgi:hypothetical protein
MEENQVRILMIHSLFYHHLHVHHIHHTQDITLHHTHAHTLQLLLFQSEDLVMAPAAEITMITIVTTIMIMTADVADLGINDECITP